MSLFYKEEELLNFLDKNEDISWHNVVKTHELSELMLEKLIDKFKNTHLVSDIVSNQKFSEKFIRKYLDSGIAYIYNLGYNEKFVFSDQFIRDYSGKIARHELRPFLLRVKFSEDFLYNFIPDDIEDVDDDDDIIDLILETQDLSENFLMKVSNKVKLDNLHYKIISKNHKLSDEFVAILINKLSEDNNFYKETLEELLSSQNLSLELKDKIEMRILCYN